MFPDRVGARSCPHGAILTAWGTTISAQPTSPIPDLKIIGRSGKIGVQNRGEPSVRDGRHF